MVGLASELGFCPKVTVYGALWSPPARERRHMQTPSLACSPLWQQLKNRFPVRPATPLCGSCEDENVLRRYRKLLLSNLETEMRLAGVS